VNLGVGLVGVAFLVGAISLLFWTMEATRPVLADRVRNAIDPGSGTPSASRAGAAGARVRLALAAFGSATVLSQRLVRAGWHLDVEKYRLRRLWLALGAALSGAAASLAAGADAGFLLVALIGFGFGHLACDYALSRAVAARAIRLTTELPALAELLAFAVSAGESTTGALRRVVATSSGELVGELSVALADVRAGQPLPVALTAMSERVGVPAVQRFVAGLVLAADRGTPMAEVLRAQSADARAHGQRMLIEAAGRREVFMLMPVVFLILPTVVVVALFPGLAALHLSVP